MKDGTVTAVETKVWGTGGTGGFNAPPVPYVFTENPNTKVTSKASAPIAAASGHGARESSARLLPHDVGLADTARCWDG